MNTQDKIEKPRQLNLKDPEIYELAAELARRHGDSLSGAVKTALKETIAREDRTDDADERYRRMKAVLEQYWSLPLKDTRTADEILGYDENGLPT